MHREEKGAPRSDEDKLKEAAKKAGEAALETKAGKALQEKVKETPLVKEATKFLGHHRRQGRSPAGAVAAGVGALAAAKQPLPFQAPAIPLDKVTPGLSAKVTVEGPRQRADLRRPVAHLQGAGAEGQGRADREGADRRRHRAAPRPAGDVQAAGPEGPGEGRRAGGDRARASPSSRSGSAPARCCR